MKKSLLTFLLLGITNLTANAVQTSVGLVWQYATPSGNNPIYNSTNTIALAGAGNVGILGDGFVLQLGYYSSATTSNPFLGTWTPLLGSGGATGIEPTASMGDITSPAPTSTSDDSFTFSDTIFGNTTGIPVTGTVMSIRFYDATSVGSATHYGAVSKSTWLWISPTFPAPVPGMSFDMTSSGLVYEATAGHSVGGTITRAQTNISTVPEPSTYALLGTGLLTTFTLLRRRKMA